MRFIVIFVTAICMLFPTSEMVGTSVLSFYFWDKIKKKSLHGNFSIIISSNTRVDISFSSVCADYYSLSVDKSQLLIC